MTNLGGRTFTALYVGLSSVAVYLMMHAALTGTKVPQTSTTNPTSVALQQVGSSSSTTSVTNPSGSSSTPTTGQSSTGNLASQQYDQTTNWAGYATTGGTYTSVSSSWQVPTASGSGETSADATWIGIGGITASDLIQVGTQNIVDPDGVVTTSAFYEMLPDASVTIPSVTVNAGDEVSASVKEVTSGEWQITFKDTTNGESFNTLVSYTSSASSAEWIEEDPSDGNSQQIPLDSFGSVTFTDGLTDKDGSNVSIAKSGAQEVSMINGEDESLASVSSLGSSGEGFTVTRTTAAAGSGITEFNNNPGSWIRRGSGMGFGEYGLSGYREPYQSYGF